MKVGENERGKTYSADAQLHSLSVQFDGFVVIPLLVFFESLGDQEVGTLQVHLLPRLQRVALLGLTWRQRVMKGLRNHMTANVSPVSYFHTTTIPQ